MRVKERKRKTDRQTNRRTGKKIGNGRKRDTDSERDTGIHI